jgi:flagellar protein FlaJ
MAKKKEEFIRVGDVTAMQAAYAPKIERKVDYKRIVIVITVVFGLVFGILGAIKMLDEYNTKTAVTAWNTKVTNWHIQGSIPSKNPGPKPEASFDTGPVAGIDLLMIACLGCIGPVGFYMNAENAKVKDIERRLPEFLRDIAESGRFGMTLAASIQAAAKGKYGPLTPAIQRMSYQISWGISATEALRLFQESQHTPLVNRVCGVVIKAASAGGNVSDVLTLVSTDTKEMQYSEDERRISMLTYIVVIYVAFFVFLATVLILNFVFIPQMESVLSNQASAAKESAASGAAAEEGASSDMGMSMKGLTTENIQAIKELYLAAAIIHGLGDGLVAGVLDTGKIANGLRHSFLMVLIAYIALRATL